jgi:hypothetical protein
MNCIARRIGLAMLLGGLLSALLPDEGGRAQTPVAREVGCYPDSRKADPRGTKGRDLDGAAFNDPAMTVNKCLSLCSTQGFRFAGLQYRTWCFCGNNYGRYAVGGASCTMRCAGDPSLFCGGEWANNIWEILSSSGAATAPSPGVPLSAHGAVKGLTQRFDEPRFGGIRVDSRPRGASGFDVVGVAHSFCRRMGFASMKEYRVGDANQTVTIEDGTIFANPKGSNTAYRYIICGT